jgi:hypothetical protein
MARQPPTDERKTGTLLRRLRTETPPIQVHRRIRALAQRGQAAYEPQLRSARNTHPSLPQETATQRRENRNSRTPSEIIMGNHNEWRI